jgi:hypothetical protein
MRRLGLLIACLWVTPGAAREEEAGLVKACEVFTTADAEALVGAGVTPKRLDARQQGYFYEQDGGTIAVAIPLESYCDYGPPAPAADGAAVPDRKVVVGVFNTFSHEAAHELYGALERDARSEASAGRPPGLILAWFPREGLGVPAFATETVASPTATDEHFIEGYALKGNLVLFATAWHRPEPALGLTRRALAQLLSRVR